MKKKIEKFAQEGKDRGGIPLKIKPIKEPTTLISHAMHPKKPHCPKCPEAIHAYMQ
jgi:hypothetical protein